MHSKHAADEERVGGAADRVKIKERERQKNGVAEKRRKKRVVIPAVPAALKAPAVPKNLADDSKEALIKK